MIGRLLDAFSRAYHQVNSKKFDNSDVVFMLAYGLVMLNTDLHHGRVKVKMSRTCYIRNNLAIPAFAGLGEPFLGSLYDGIARGPIETADVEDIDYVLSDALISGYLWKECERGLLVRWKRRWCVVVNGCLYYFHRKTDKEPSGVVPLEGVRIIRHDNSTNKNRFEIVPEDFQPPPSPPIKEKKILHRVVSLFGMLSVRDERPKDSNNRLLSSKSSIFVGGGGGGGRSRSVASFQTLKSARNVDGVMQEGRQRWMRFECASPADLDRWMEAFGRVIA